MIDLISLKVSSREVDLEFIFSSGQYKKRGIININHQEAAKINDILFLSPYVSDVSNRLIAEIRSYGITTTVAGSFNEEIEQNVARIKPRSIVEAVRDIYSGQTAIFISCTNLQTLDVIEVIEQEFSCVCFSSNQVLIWNMLRLAKIDHDVTGYGKLLSKTSKE